MLHYKFWFGAWEGSLYTFNFIFTPHEWGLTFESLHSIDKTWYYTEYNFCTSNEIQRTNFKVADDHNTKEAYKFPLQAQCRAAKVKGAAVKEKDLHLGASFNIQNFYNTL